MNTSDLYTPVRKLKKPTSDPTNKDDYDVNLRTSLNVQRKNQILPNTVQIDKIKSNPSFSLEKNTKNSL